MSKYTKEIYNFIDNISSEDERIEFILKLNNDIELKEEFLMIKNLNEHMKLKLLTNIIEKEVDYKQIEIEAKDDVSDLILNGKTDKVVLEYLSAAYPENNISVKNMITEAEEDEKINEIEKTTHHWVNEFMQDENKEPELLKLINSSSQENLKTIKSDSAQKFYKKITVNKFPGRKRLYYIVSSVAAILILIFLLNNFFNSIPKNERIFAEYHEKPIQLNSIQMRDTEQDINTVFEEASLFYKQNLFDKAFISFNKLVEEDTTFVQALFYSGLAQFENGNYEEARQIFIEVISTFDEYNIESKWCLSLVYIHSEEFDKAVPYLKEISEQKSLYQEDAKEILELIKI